jgi:4-phytase/acid phosphatase
VKNSWLCLHAVYADLMRRTPYLARTRGASLMTDILDSLKQAATGTAIPGAMGNPGDALLVLSGHDTNLSNISGMLGLSWKLPGYQPDDTPPGGALVFSLWHDSESGIFSVRTQYLAQSMKQMHEAAPLTLKTPPDITEVRLPGCREAACEWKAFQSVVEKAISQ